MTKTSKNFIERSTEVLLGESCASIAHSSGSMLKASLIAPRDIIDGLPEDLLRWLHDESEAEGASLALSRWASSADFESIIVDRLFPLRDPRTFIGRLRRHCQATAAAALLLADALGHNKKNAWVCGWLHDLGIAACIRHVDELAPIRDDDALSELWATLSRSSAKHGIRLASRWRLPSAIRHTIREHESVVTLGAPSRTVAVNFVAEHIAAVVGFEFHGQTSSVALDRAIAALELGSVDIVAVAVRTEQVMRQPSRELPLAQLCKGA